MFIDTCIFDSFKYSFDSTYFKSLATHRAAMGFVVVISAVVERETLSHIERDFSGLQTTADKFNTHIGSDYSSNFVKLISDLKQQAGATKEAVLAAWSQFKTDLRVVVLPFESVSMQDIFERYFDISSPFDAKTKNEFPDAFSAIAIEKFQAESRAGQIVIISTDGIFSKCDELYPNWFVFKRLQDFLDSIARAQPTQIPMIGVAPTLPDSPATTEPPQLEPTPRPLMPVPITPPATVSQPSVPAESILDQEDEPEIDSADQMQRNYDALARVVSLNTSHIEQAIYQHIESLTFELQGNYSYDDEHVEVSQVQLKSFRIDEINMKDQWARVAVDITLDADISFSCSVWDSIDKDYVFLDSSSESISGDYSGFIEILFDERDVEVEDVEFEALNDLSIEGELSQSFYE